MHTIPRPQWNENALPIGMELNAIMYALRKHRSASNPLSGDLLLDAVTLDDLYEDLGERVMLDAIVIQYAQIKRKMESMRRALERAATKIKPLGVEISDPFTQRGSTQIACVFSFEDGQSVTIFMHNPDTTPKKIMQKDMLTSWKWLLNKKDITIVVAPERGEDLNVNEVGRRVMKLLEKNSAAFKRANANKAERDGALQAIKDEVTALEAQLAHERELLEQAKARKAEKPHIVDISGDEFDGFPDTDEGKKALRDAVKAQLMAMRGEWVDCPALSAKVELRKRGIEKSLSASGDVRKLKLMAQIKRLIASASKTGARSPYNQADDKSAVAYYTLRAFASLDGQKIAVRLVIKEDVNGKFHYDATVHDVGAVFDSAQSKGRDDARPVLPLLPMAGEQNPSRFASDQLDSILEPGREYVNLFIEGEEPEVIDLGAPEEAPAQEPAQPTQADDGLSDDPNAENYRYKDTGIIEGARKFSVTEQFREAVKNGRMLSSKDIDWEGLEENPRRAKELVVKSNLFGQVPWGDLRDAGMEPGAGFLIDRVYASIQSEPEDNPEARKDYAHGIESVRGRLEACKTAEDVRDTLNEMRQELRGVILTAKESEDFQAAMARAKALSPKNHPVAIEHNRLRNAAFEKRMALIATKNPGGRRKPVQAEVDLAQAEYDKAENDLSAYFEAHPELQNKSRELANGWLEFGNDIEFAYRQAREEASAIEKIAVNRNINERPTTRAWVALGKRFGSILTGKSETFAGHRGNVAAGKVKDWSWAEKGGSAPRATKKGATFQLLVADKIERVGGREVKIESTMALKDAFGFRDVQSGNWVLKDPASAQFHVQRSAEAITDLADLIGFEPAKFAMKGRLALAFGARGTGNAGGHSAMAHYEPVERVINITKMKGGGSLAHEWFHALDNMMPEAMGVAGGGAGEFVAANSELSKKLPEAVNAALVNLRKAMTEGEHQATESRVITPADRRLAEAYMSTAPKQSERSISKQIFLAGNLDAAVRVVDQAEKRDKEQTLARGKKWTKRDSDPWENWRKIAIAHYAKPDQDVVEFKTGEPMSMFKLEAMKLDAGRSKPYWSTTLEMAARAFQGYVEDGLKRNGQRNDYLSYGAQNEMYEDANPYPAGDERIDINWAFRELFQAMKGTGVLDSVFGLMF